MKNNSKQYFNTILLFFYIFIFLLIYERHLCFSLGLYTADKWNNFFYVFICENLKIDFWSENKLVENIQSFLLLISILIFFVVLKKIDKKNKFIFYFFSAFFLGLIYYLGEEISWGQHILKWKSPNIFVELNHQKETNLHNISNLFNEIPRSIVLIWCSISALLASQINKLKKFKLIICPINQLLFISFSLILVLLPDLFLSKLDIEFNRVTQRLTLNFLRLSELQELIICFYFFIYSLSIYKNLEKIKKFKLDYD